MAHSMADTESVADSDETTNTEAGSNPDDNQLNQLPGTNNELDSEAESLDMDDVFHILQNERRRNVLRYLEDVDDVIEMRDMAVQIAAWENEISVQQLHSDQRQRVYIALYQSHLPKLDELGLIDYNKPRGYVDPRPRLDTVLAYLNPEPAVGSPTDEEVKTASASGSKALFGVTGVATLLVAAGWFGMAPALFSGLGIATAVLVLFAAAIAYTHRSELGRSSTEDN